MIRTTRDYNNAIKSMIRRVQSAKSADAFDTFNLSAEDAEILLDCIAAGYLIGKIPANYRTLDGKAHPELTNTFVTPKGLAMLEPSKTEIKSNIALVTSIVAAAISAFALVVSLLANLDKMLENWTIVMSWLSL